METPPGLAGGAGLVRMMVSLRAKENFGRTTGSGWEVAGAEGGAGGAGGAASVVGATCKGRSRPTPAAYSGSSPSSASSLVNRSSIVSISRSKGTGLRRYLSTPRLSA